MTHKGLEKWHHCMATKNPADMDDFLHDEVVFFSPVVYTPQKGKQITKAYLMAASHALADGFIYTKEVITDKHCILEFECEINGKYVNGVDMITFDESGKCTEFKVMVRPLQAVNAIHQAMMVMLEKMKG